MEIKYFQKMDRQQLTFQKVTKGKFQKGKAKKERVLPEEEIECRVLQNNTHPDEGYEFQNKKEYRVLKWKGSSWLDSTVFRGTRFQDYTAKSKVEDETASYHDIRKRVTNFTFFLKFIFKCVSHEVFQSVTHETTC